MTEIRKTDMEADDAKLLIGELNDILCKITGDDGTAHFHKTDVNKVRSVFLICYSEGKPVACGALREHDSETGEIKRVYSRKNSIGAGRLIINALEAEARNFGYKKLVLETRKLNLHAIDFYSSLGYTHCPNYGAYIGNPKSYCMAKTL